MEADQEAPRNDGRTTDGKWQAGHSGNPRGRPRGVGKVAELRAKLTDRAEGVLATVFQAAARGDIAAAALILRKCMPDLRVEALPEPFDMPEGSLSEKGESVLRAVANGELSASTGAELMAALGGLSRIKEVDDLEKRLHAVEQRLGTPPEDEDE